MAEKRPTILQIIPELETGGAELATIEIAGAVTRAGGRALVLSQGGRLAPALAQAGGELIPFPAATKNPLRIIRNAKAIARLVDAEGIDLIHARSRAPAWSALLAARRTKRPFVTTYHGAYKEKGRFKNWYNSIMARGDVVIANSRFTADLIKARYATPDDRVTVIHRGVDGAAFDPAAVSAERIAALRAAWGLSGSEPVILQAARLTSWKGQSVLIEAARHLAQSGRLGSAVVVLAGDDQGRKGYVDELKAQIAASGLAGQVRLVGHVADMPAAFCAAHVAVVASVEPEAFGRAATEAQVMGCPVIATAIGAPPETVLAPPKTAIGAHTGWLVPPGDAPALAEVVAAALAMSAPERQGMAARARHHVLGAFSLARMCRETLAVYDRLLSTNLAAALPTPSLVSSPPDA